jgi:hypothetical protein
MALRVKLLFRKISLSRIKTTLILVLREEKLPEGRAKKAKLAYMVLLLFLLVAWSAALIGI